MADELEVGEDGADGAVHLQVILGKFRKKHQYSVRNFD